MATSVTLAGPTTAGGAVGWRSSWIEVVLFLGGAGLFAMLLRRIGVAPIAEALRSLGLALPLIIGVEGLAVLANTLSWRCTIPPDQRGRVRFRRLAAARLVGDAVNYVFSEGAGEIPRIRLLSRYMSMEQAVASVAMAKLTEGVALGVFGILGLVLAWPVLATRAAGGMAIAAAALLGVGLVAGSLVAVRAGFLTVVVRVFHRLTTTQDDRARLARAAVSKDADRALFQQGLVGSTVWHLVGWLVNVGELWLACHYLGLRPSLGVVFAGEALAALLDGVFLFVPMRIGASEGGRVFVFGLLGLGATVGLTLGLVRRVRELAWTVAGLATYPWLARVDRTVPGGGGGQGRRDGVAVT